MAAVGLAVLDYAVLAIMLIISAAIGVYSACSGDRQRTSAEYLLGNRQMNFVTVGLSIMISFTSAVGLLSAPTEIYLFGTTYWWTVLSIAAGALLSAHTILPVFYRLGVTSIYTVCIFHLYHVVIIHGSDNANQDHDSLQTFSFEEKDKKLPKLLDKVFAQMYLFRVCEANIE